MPINRRILRARRNFLLLLVLLAAVAVGVYLGVRWLLLDRFHVTTDNAFVVGNLIPIQSDATGVVVEILREETQQVKKGDLLVRLDAQRAGAALAQAEGELARAVRSVGALFASKRQVCEKIASRLALRDRTRHDVARYKQALPSGSVSHQMLQNAEDQLSSLEADLRESRAELQSVEARISGVTRKDHPDIETAKSRFLDASIEYARQRILAPVSGYVAKRKVQVGQRVRPGDQLMTIVPLDNLWIEANLWENRMAEVRPGQPVKVTVDLYGRSVAYQGTVEGIVPGSGAVFALMPPDNATGNFIHIVQRVPVRIALRPDELEKQPLRPGLSTYVSIDVSESKVSPHASVVNPISKEYATDLFDKDLARAKAKAEEIIAKNSLAKTESDGAPCPGE